MLMYLKLGIINFKQNNYKINNSYKKTMFDLFVRSI